jgi:hypothetical protein
LEQGLRLAGLLGREARRNRVHAGRVAFDPDLKCGPFRLRLLPSI